MSIQEWDEVLADLHESKWFIEEATEKFRAEWRDRMVARLISVTSVVGELKNPPSVEQLLSSHPDLGKASASLAEIEAKIAKVAAEKRRKE